MIATFARIWGKRRFYWALAAVQGYTAKAGACKPLILSAAGTLRWPVTGAKQSWMDRFGASLRTQPPTPNGAPDMSLIKRFFGSKDRGGDAVATPETETEAAGAAPNVEPAHIVPSSRRPLTITAEALNSLFPIRNLSDDVREAFALDRVAEVCGAGSVLFVRGAPADSIFYLLEGTVRMEIGDDTHYQVSADTAKARFPLCSGQVCSATARALTDVQVLQVSPKIMSHNPASANHERMRLDPFSPDIPEAIRQSRIFQAFCHYYHDETLKLPSLPDVAVRLRKAMESDVSMEEVARIVQMDPAIAAKLIHVANSPLYLPVSPITTCQDAVTRLGLVATRNLVISYSLRQIFKCRDPYINQLLHTEWKKSLNLSCLCWVLASENGGVNPQQAQLAGLVADIGIVPFLHFAENFPREYWKPEEIEQVLPHVREPLGIFLLTRLDFPPELVEIPHRAEAWLEPGGPTIELADIVMLSKLHSFIGSPRMGEMPAINSVPACAKLVNGTLTPELSLKVLHDAKDKIQQSLKLFDI